MPCSAITDLNEQIRSNGTQHQPGPACSETSAHEIRTPGYHPKERIQQSEHGVKWE